MFQKGEYPLFEKHISIDSNRVQCTESEKIYPIEKFRANAEILGFQGFEKKRGVPLFSKKIFDRF